MSNENKRGFAAMSPEKQKEIAGKGGRAAHEKGTAHKFTTEEARAAGRKGGAIASQDREHMRAIGRLGGQARGKYARVADGADSVAKMAENPDEANHLRAKVALGS